MTLPFKDDNMRLPDHKKQALLCLGKLHQRLKNDEMYNLDYTKFMCEIICFGYAFPVPEQELNLKDGRVW